MFASPLPLPDPIASTDERVINFQSLAEYSIYKDILIQNYGQNEFIQKNEINDGIVYRFKFRGEEVFVALYATILLGTLHINGNGGTNWFHEAHTILDDQCKRHLLSGKLQTPEALPQTDENKKELLSEEEFFKCFAHPYAYGRDCDKWPDSTILLYKYISNATTKYRKIPENTWKRIDNIPSIKDVRKGKHAELIMIEDMKKIQDYLTTQPDDYEGSYKAIISVEVILSYSPCANCSESLCQLKKTLDEKVKISKTKHYSRDTFLQNFTALSLKTEVDEAEKIKMKITFSNFYKHKEIRNMNGLKNLLKSDIKLDTFTDENWKYFFKAAGLITVRLSRERAGKKMLQYLEESVALEETTATLQSQNLIY